MYLTRGSRVGLNFFPVAPVVHQCNSTDFGAVTPDLPPCKREGNQARVCTRNCGDWVVFCVFLFPVLASKMTALGEDPVPCTGRAPCHQASRLFPGDRDKQAKKAMQMFPPHSKREGGEAGSGSAHTPAPISPGGAGKAPKPSLPQASLRKALSRGWDAHNSC